jgi:hypothetical protein
MKQIKYDLKLREDNQKLHQGAQSVDVTVKLNILNIVGSDSDILDRVYKYSCFRSPPAPKCLRPSLSLLLFICNVFNSQRYYFLPCKMRFT